MAMKKTIILAGALALSAFAAPIPEPEKTGRTAVATSNPVLTAEILMAIAPNTADCNGANNPYPGECADATAAATALNKAFQTYQITTPGEQAAIVAYELFESVNFKAKKNKSQNLAGQGTRMMAMPPVVHAYATAVAGQAAVAQAQTAGGADGVLALVNSDDEKSFGSAAWYLTTTCSPQVRQGLQAETVQGWHDFLTQCVQTTAVEARDTIWVKTKQIILGSSK